MSRARKLLNEIHGLNSARGSTVRFTYSKPGPPKDRNHFSDTSLTKVFSQISDAVDDLEVTLGNFVKNRTTSRVIEKYIEMEDSFVDVESNIKLFGSQMYEIRNSLNSR